MALYFSKYPAGVTVMNSYLFARQYQRDQWTKMDYDDARLTGFTNLAEYNQVREMHTLKISRRFLGDDRIIYDCKSINIARW